MKSVYLFSLSSVPAKNGQPVSSLCNSLEGVEVRGLLSLSLERLLDDRAKKMFFSSFVIKQCMPIPA